MAPLVVRTAFKNVTKECKERERFVGKNTLTLGGQ
jgi:hypothetical protein